MPTFSPLLDQLIDALRCLPGVGPKSAQRMAFHLLERGRDNGRELAKILDTALTHLKHCQQCRTFTEDDCCSLCNNPHRDKHVLCIVESPADVLAIEQTAHFRGLYFVLMGRLSPMDGIGPEELGLNHVLTLVSQREVKEVILATNPTVEGEATAHYLMQLLKQYRVKVTRIAQGVPLGGNLEYIDTGTLARALSERILLEE